MPADRPENLSEEQAKRVLERAARIDASDRLRVSVPELRNAAMEAGISASALDLALSEITDPQPAASDAAAGTFVRFRRKWVYAAAIIIVVLLFGFARTIAPGGSNYIEDVPIAVPAPAPELPPPPPPAPPSPR